MKTDVDGMGGDYAPEKLKPGTYRASVSNLKHECSVCSIACLLPTAQLLTGQPEC